MNSKNKYYAPILFSAVLILSGFSQKLGDIIAGFSVDSFLSVSVIQLAVFLLPLAFYCKICGINYVKNLKFNYFPVNRISFCAIMLFLFFFISLFLRYIGITFFRGAMTDTPNIINITNDTGKPVLSFLVFVVLPAIFEEILFRGILLSEYEIHSKAVAVIVTSLMYAMAHCSLENLVYYFIIGIIFGAVTVVTDSVIPALVLHFAFNMSYFYFTDKLVDYLRQTGKSTLLPFILVALIFFILFLMFSSLEDIYRDKAFGEYMKNRKELLRQSIEKDEETEKKGFLRCLSEMVLSPTFILSIVIFICISTNLF